MVLLANGVQRGCQRGGVVGRPDYDASPTPGFTRVEPRIPAPMAGPGCDGVVGRPPLGSPRSRVAIERRGSTSLAPTAFSPGQASASA